LVAEITLNGIEQAISGLNYRNKEGLKYRLLHEIRKFYETDKDVTDLEQIDTDELIRQLWMVENHHETLLSKRKNLNSIKSSVNADLKKAFDEGKNPEGIIIGPFNTFILSDEAKDRFVEILKEKGFGSGNVDLDRITEMLSRIDDILTNAKDLQEINSIPTAETMAKINHLVKDVFNKIQMVGLVEKDESFSGIFQGINRASDGDTENRTDKKEDDLSNGSEKETFIEGRHPGATDIGGKDDNLIDLEDIESEIVEIEEDDEDDVVEVEEDPVEIEDIDTIIAADIEEEINENMHDSFSEIDQIKTSAPIGDDDANPNENYGSLSEKTDLENDTIDSENLNEDIAEISDKINEDIAEISEELDEDIAEIDEDDILDLAEADDDTTENSSGENIPDQGNKAETEIPDVHFSTFDEPMPSTIPEGEKDVQKARVLSETFNWSLSSMDRFFNQYIFIPEGEYRISDRLDPSFTEKLPSDRTLFSPSFYFGKFPVTNALFEIFVVRTGYTTTAEKLGFGQVYQGRSQKIRDKQTGQEKLIWNSVAKNKMVKGACWYQPFGPGSTIHRKRNHPVTQVSFEDAMAFAAWTGKRLPTETEWEIASRTHKSHLFPWGVEWNVNASNVEESNIGDTTCVDQYLEFANDFGITDTLGNVMEWTCDQSDASLQTHKKTLEYIVKGGSWISSGPISLVQRFQLESEAHSNILGFRCVAV